WWVPRFGGKYDAIPGHVNHTWFDAAEGTYVARCAELCGIQHAVMQGLVKVVPRDEYESFIAARAEGGLPLGKEEFDGVCSKCHRLDHRYIGPALAGNPTLTDRHGLETLLRNGLRDMPAVGKDWSGAQIDARVAYAKTL